MKTLELTLPSLAALLTASTIAGGVLVNLARYEYIRRRNRGRKLRAGTWNNAAASSPDGETANQTEASAHHPQAILPHHSQPSDVAECYLLLHHVSKSHNVGMLCRTAAAFGCTAVICVGLRKASQLSFFGAHGSDRRVKVLCFLYLNEAVDFVKRRASVQGRKCRVVGIEITPESKLLPDISTFEASEVGTKKPENVCFIPGNEGIGLTEKDRKYCDSFVVIPQYGSGTASLNVHAAVSVVLYQFAVRAGLKEAPREKEKYVVSSVSESAKAFQEQGLIGVDASKSKPELPMNAAHVIADGGEGVEDDGLPIGFGSM